MTRILLLWCCGAAGLAHAGSSRWAENAKLEIRHVDVLTAAPTCASRLDVRVALTGSYQTPFDPGEIAADAQFSLPSGRRMTVPAFFYQPFARVPGASDNVAPAGAPEWRIRFTPPEAGAYTVQVTARDHSGSVQSGPVSFEARRLRVEVELAGAYRVGGTPVLVDVIERAGAGLGFGLRP